MNSGVPWNVDDVRPLARDAALEAARRSGMPLGEWLSNVIFAQAAKQGASPPQSESQPPAPKAQPPAPNPDEESIAETMERIQRHLQQSALESIPPPPPQKLPGTPVPQARGPEAYAPRRATQSASPSPAPAGKSSPALDQVMAEIAARQRAIDGDAISPAAVGSGPPDMSGLEKQLRHLTAQIETLHRPNPVESAIKALRNDLAEIGRAITHAMPRHAVEALESEIRKLGARIDQNRQSLEPAGIAGTERRLADILGSLGALTPAERLAGVDEALSGLGRKLDQMMAKKQDPGSLPQVEAAIMALRGVVSHVASAEALSKLRDEVGALAARIKPISLAPPAQTSLASVHETIKRLGDRLAMSKEELRSGTDAVPDVPTARPLSPVAPVAHSSPVAAPIESAAPSGPKHQPLDPSLPADHPLEPGSGIPARRLVASGAERVTTPEPAARTGAQHSGLADFIAAARRAAKAAAPSLAPNDPAAEDSDPNSRKTLSQRMRSLLPGAGIVLLAAGSVYLATKPNTPKPVVSAAPPAQSQPATPPLAGIVHTIQSVNAAPPQFTRPASDEKRNRAESNEVTGSIAALPDGPSSTHALTPPPPQQVPQLSDKLPPNLRKAAAIGNPAAEYEVALRHLEGRGVAQSAEEAARWFDRAAKSGLVPAQFRLGSLYEKGHGVKKNRETARGLYLVAAESGNAKAMHNLAVLYAEGIIGKPDYQTAALWFRKAAGHGVSDSQYNLGILYARGAGVEQNLAESYKWFALAAAQGDKDSTSKREDVGARLDPQTLMAAKLAVQTFVVEPQPEEATNVKAPEGGWDRPSAGTSPAAPAKKRLATPRP